MRVRCARWCPRCHRHLMPRLTSDPESGKVVTWPSFSFLFHTRQAAHQQLSLMQSTVGGIIAPHLSRLCLLNDVLIKRPKCARFYRNVSVNKATSNKHGRQTLQFTAITPIEYRRKKEYHFQFYLTASSLFLNPHFSKKRKNWFFFFFFKYLRLQFVWLWAYIESLYVFFLFKKFFYYIIIILFLLTGYVYVYDSRSVPDGRRCPWPTTKLLSQSLFDGFILDAQYNLLGTCLSLFILKTKFCWYLK